MLQGRDAAIAETRAASVSIAMKHLENGKHDFLVLPRTLPSRADIPKAHIFTNSPPATRRVDPASIHRDSQAQ